VVTEIRIYFEGDKRLRPGFRIFLDEIYKRASHSRRQVRLISTKGKPVEDYMAALKTHPHARNILLLDSEGPAGDSLSALCQKRGIPVSNSESVFWMVQLMEAWFLADPEALQQYYGRGFRASSLPGNPRVEEVSKKDVCQGLREATRSSGKGEYDKTAHAPHLLQLIQPDKVRHAAPGCSRMFQTIIGGLDPTQP
jgi:Domain of unknown function (DUF4276)